MVRGLKRRNLGDNKGAIEDYSKAIELNPEDPFPGLTLSLILKIMREQ